MDPKYRFEEIRKLEGNYYTYKDQNKINFFQPNVFFSKEHCWYLTDTPVATLCINLLESPSNKEDFITMINLEIDLMAGSGFTIALVVIVDTNLKLMQYLFEKTLEKHKSLISEIHINFLTDNIDKNSLLFHILAHFISFSSLYLGYIYIYSPFYDNNPTIAEALKKAQSDSRIYHIQFSEKLTKAFRLGTMHEEFNFCHKDSTIFYKQKPFVYTKIGHEFTVIRVMLSNVPLYNTDDQKNDVIPSCSSGFSFGYILKADFMTWKPTRISILFEDKNNFNRISQKYIDFNDIHIIRPDFYVKSTLFLTNTDRKTLKTVNSILKSANKKLDETKGFKKENFFSLFKNQKIKKGLKYIVYAYQHYMHDKNKNRSFQIHTNQIFTALEACRACLLGNKNEYEDNSSNDEEEKDSNEKKVKGVVYQVKTGEGKSCIIQLVAAVLALSNRMVHVTSSNINLANRDYCESIEFFRKLGLKSAVLLHQNEIPSNENQDDLDGNNHIKFSKDLFPDIYLCDSLFENSSRMNFDICGINNDKNKPNIIFSNFVNFESLYLRLMERYIGYVMHFFNNCSLVIDEADSILIDELTNGTILSRPMRSNGKDILLFVYRCFKENKSAEYVYDRVREQWPKCTDLKLKDIKNMFEEINIINQLEFTNGKKYSVETIPAKEKRDGSDDEDYIINEDEIYDGKSHKKIVPFDYDHKGILEPNKEFSGFIQQFIAIKEMENNKEEYQDMIIKSVSMNYLYVSHPIFVNLYNGICGLTGTIGNSEDKKIFKEQYNLLTKKIPSDKPNHRIELPIILCLDLKERNERIVNEIIGFHSMEYPVLVIFQDLNEISEVANLLISKGLIFINIFDGKNKDIKPDNISGQKGAISLGTNFCGRGTDIKNKEKPLHVIVSYYTSNKRVMHQAYGRTARQGSDGTVRVICLLDDFISPKKMKDEMSTNLILNEYLSKNLKQKEFIEKFRKNREWIFDGHIKSEKLDIHTLVNLRKARINVNRIKAYKCEFPICMSIKTFLDIQAQKICSIYNCPNCKYSWMLFQKYIREMILESWSLFIEKAERNYRNVTTGISYNDYLNQKFEKLIDKLNEYLPLSNKSDSNIFEIVPTFMHIFNKVVDKYEKTILNMYPNEMDSLYKSNVSNRYVALFVGFRPYSLIDRSGARINVTEDPENPRNFINDPELKYLKKQPKGAPIFLSITEKIDHIYDLICKKINELFGSFMGLKFFLRRTLGGCEFGMCFDVDIENTNNEVLKNLNCIIDKDPLLVFTISVKSFIPILAGILIILLVFAKNIAMLIKEKILIPSGITDRILDFFQDVVVTQKAKIALALIGFLTNILTKQIIKVKERDIRIGTVFEALFSISKNKDFSKDADILDGMFGNHSLFKMRSNGFKKFLSAIFPLEYVLKIGFLLLLIFSSFMMSFYINHKAVKFSSKKASADYEKDKDPNKPSIDANEKYISKEKDEMGKIKVELNET